MLPKVVNESLCQFDSHFSGCLNGKILGPAAAGGGPVPGDSAGLTDAVRRDPMRGIASARQARTARTLLKKFCVWASDGGRPKEPGGWPVHV